MVRMFRRVSDRLKNCKLTCTLDNEIPANERPIGKVASKPVATAQEEATAVGPCETEIERRFQPIRRQQAVDETVAIATRDHDRGSWKRLRIFRAFRLLRKRGGDFDFRATDFQARSGRRT